MSRREKQLCCCCSRDLQANENLQLAANFYFGKDNEANIARFHHNNSIVARYYNQAKKKSISQAAFCINTHYGFQNRGAVSPKTNYMTGMQFRTGSGLIKTN